MKGLRSNLRHCSFPLRRVVLYSLNAPLEKIKSLSVSLVRLIMMAGRGVLVEEDLRESL